VLTRVPVCPRRAGSLGSAEHAAALLAARRRNGFWRHTVGSPASGRYCERERSCLCFPLGVSGIVPSLGARGLRRISRRGCRVFVRNDHARMLRDVADNGFAAVAHRHVLHGDGGLAMAPVAVQRFDLGGKRAGEPAQCARGAVVPGDVVRIREVMGTPHRHHMNRNHLRHQHGLDGIPRLDALHHRNHEGEVDLVGTPAAHAGLYQLSENAIHRFAIGDPQRVRHELFAELPIGMVDGETVRREPYPRGGGSFGLAGCGNRRWHSEVRSGVHVGIPWQARRKRAVRPRAGDRSPRRADAISMVGESLSRNRGRRACYCRATGVYKITGW
jgi:hypothetical protein